MNIDYLTFELTSDGNELHIHGDPAGLRRLAAQLERLTSSPSADHEHLFTATWGGNDLSQEAQGDAVGDRLLHSVTLHSWPKSR